MDALIAYLQNMWNTFVAWVKGIWDDFMEWTQDFWIDILDEFLQGVAAVVSAIPAPAFLTRGLGGYLGGIDPAVLYFLSQSGLTDAFAILGAGLVFRLTRKLFTLGQW